MSARWMVRADNLQGFSRALKLSVAALRRSASAESADETTANESEEPAVVHRQTLDVVRLFNSSFTGDPLTPADAI